MEVGGSGSSLSPNLVSRPKREMTFFIRVVPGYSPTTGSMAMLGALRLTQTIR